MEVTDENENNNEQESSTSSSSSVSTKAIELPEGVLTRNLAVPIIIVGCQGDAVNSSRMRPADAEHDYKLLQLKLRNLGKKISDNTPSYYIMSFFLFFLFFGGVGWRGGK